MAQKPKRAADPASVAPKLYQFSGHLRYVEAAAVRHQLPVRLVPKIANSIPLTIATRILAGLAEISRRANGRAFLDAEMALIRSALEDAVEVPWHFRMAANVAGAMLADVRRKVSPEPVDSGVDGPDEVTPPDCPFVGIGPYLAAERDRLGIHELIADRVRHVPELARISTRLARVHDGLRRGTMPSDSLHAEVGCATEDATILQVLAVAAESMLTEAYRAFGLEMPTTPPAGRPESRCCAPHLYRDRSRKPAAAFFA